MAKIKIKGVIIPNDYKWLYDWFEMDSTSPKDVETALEAAGEEDVEVYINSGGGDVYAGSEIYTLLKEHKGNTIGKIVGVAASAASVGAMGCKKLMMTPTGQLMIHNAASSARGDYRVMQHSAEVLKGWNKSISNAYLLKTGMESQELLALMNKETWLTAQQALEMKFVDEIMFDSSSQLVASADSLESMIPSKVIEKLRNSGLLKSFNFENITNAAQKGVDQMPKFEDVLAKLPQEEQDVVTAHIDTSVGNATTEAQKAWADEKQQLLNTIENLKKAPTGEGTDPLANLTPEAKAIVEAANLKAAEAEAKLKDIEDKRELGEFEAKVKGFDRLPMNAAEYAPILRNVAKTDAEGYKKLEALLTAVNNIVDASKVFDTNGSSHAVAGDAYEQLQAKAREMKVKDTTLTDAKAFTQACKENPELYDQYLKEREGDE